jgi:hypothetical protein
MKVALWTPLAGTVASAAPLLARELELVIVGTPEGARPKAELDVYHVRDSPACGFIYRALVERAGVVVLDHWNLHALVFAETAGRGKPDVYRREARRGARRRRQLRGTPDARGLGGELGRLVSMNRRVLESSLGLVSFDAEIAARAATLLPGRPVLHVAEPQSVLDDAAAVLAKVLLRLLGKLRPHAERERSAIAARRAAETTPQGAARDELGWAARELGPGGPARGCRGPRDALPGESMSAPSLSVVIPAFNEALRLPATLARVRSHLGARQPSFEIVVVDDGSTDATAEVARAVAAPIVVLRHAQNRGKGHAVRAGMLAARGERRLDDRRGPLDADRGARAARGGARPGLRRGDRLARSRGRPDRGPQPAYREAMGRLFNRLVQALLLPGLHDTQCGFKLFTAAAAAAAFSPAASTASPSTWRRSTWRAARLAHRRAAGGVAQRRGDPRRPRRRRLRLPRPAADPARGGARPLRAAGRAFATDVAHVRAAPQLAHPCLDALVERAPLEPLADPLLLASNDSPGLRVASRRRAHLLVAHAQLRPEAELHVLEDRDLAPQDAPQARLSHLGRQRGLALQERGERALFLVRETSVCVRRDASWYISRSSITASSAASSASPRTRARIADVRQQQRAAVDDDHHALDRGGARRMAGRRRRWDGQKDDENEGKRIRGEREGTKSATPSPHWTESR